MHTGYGGSIPPSSTRGLLGTHMLEPSMKAGTPCPRCGGQVMPRWEADMESRVDLEDTCVQCGFQPNIPRPSPDELVRITASSWAEKHRGVQPTVSEPEVFRCKRPGCGVEIARMRIGGGYCSLKCWYLHRPELMPKPEKAFWRGDP